MAGPTLAGQYQRLAPGSICYVDASHFQTGSGSYYMRPLPVSTASGSTGGNVYGSTSGNVYSSTGGNVYSSTGTNVYASSSIYTSAPIPSPRRGASTAPGPATPRGTSGSLNALKSSSNGAVRYYALPGYVVPGATTLPPPHASGGPAKQHPFAYAPAQPFAEQPFAEQPFGERLFGERPFAATMPDLRTELPTAFSAGAACAVQRSSYGVLPMMRGESAGVSGDLVHYNHLEHNNHLEHTGLVHTGLVHTGPVHTGLVQTGLVHGVHNGGDEAAAAAALGMVELGDDEALEEDVLQLITPKARTAVACAIDDVMDDAIDSFIQSAYSEIFPCASLPAV